ncbi:hypothetical protein LTR66_009762 [Elasticomyces elasticus]|nr:hypothetical protein LTR66_009762 [Elasticomyces elasticus]
MLERHGHSHDFEGSPLGNLHEANKAEVVEEGTLEVRSQEAEYEAEVREKRLSVRTITDILALEGLETEKETIPGATVKDILGWLTNVYKSSRGFELGTFVSSLLAMTIKTLI